MTSQSIFLGAKEFMENLALTASSAKKSLYVQAMTFEGDQAGQQLVDIMIASPAKDKRLLIDNYSKVVINDQFVFGPSYVLDTAFREEVKFTKELVKIAKSNGIRVQFTNPVGLLLSRYPCRNHKKMVVVDGVTTYLGGINFSDHNFAWHDFMMRSDDEELSQLIHQDFLQTWEGKNASSHTMINSGDVFFMNGIKSQKLYERLFQIVGQAKKEITVISPYVSEPLLTMLQKHVPEHVCIKIISPKENNKSIFYHHLRNEALKGYFELWSYQLGMSHMKAILIDNERLVVGSSNFDFASYFFEQEVVYITNSQEVIQEFTDRVINSDLRDCEMIDIEAITPRYSESLKVKIVYNFCAFASKIFWHPN